MMNNNYDLEKVVDRILLRLMGIYPSVNTTFTEDQLLQFKNELGLAIKDNNLTLEDLKYGLEVARTDDNNFICSVGKFIKWCKSKELSIFLSDSIIENYVVKFNNDDRAIKDLTPINREFIKSLSNLATKNKFTAEQLRKAIPSEKEVFLHIWKNGGVESNKQLEIKKPKAVKQNTNEVFKGFASKYGLNESLLKKEYNDFLERRKNEK